MNRSALALSGLLLLCVTGCAAVAITAAAVTGVVYISGEASKSYAATVDETCEATIRVMDGLELPVLEQRRSGDGWLLRSRRSTDAEEVKINIVSSGENLTEVKVRVGVFGDKEYSTDLLVAIEENL